MEQGKINIKDADELKQEKDIEQEAKAPEENEEAGCDACQQPEAAEVSNEQPEPEVQDEAQTQGTSEDEVTQEPDPEPQTEETEETADENAREEEQGKGASKKKERKLKWAREAAQEIQEQVDAAKEKLAEANDRYARLFAEFDNFRKRSEKEKMQRYDFGAKDMVERILPVIDNFERGLAAVSQEGREEDSFVKGMEMTYKQLLKVLEDAGVKPIEAVGQEFNPEFHNAVMHVDDPEVPENVIVEEFQKGYMYKDHVVRYSMVKVAN